MSSHNRAGQHKVWLKGGFTGTTGAVPLRLPELLPLWPLTQIQTVPTINKEKKDINI